jgi:hypothetical protein
MRYYGAKLIYKLKDKDNKMKELNYQEIEQVNGGWFLIVARIVGPTLINMAVHAIKKKNRHEEITPQGLAIAGGAGAIGGAIGVAGGMAAGGTLIGNAVWAPSNMAISASGNAISQNY